MATIRDIAAKIVESVPAIAAVMPLMSDFGLVKIDSVKGSAGPPE
jgi:hypothetical protein